MTSHDLKQIQGFIEEHYDLFSDYLRKGVDSNKRSQGEAAAAEIYRALGDATQFTSELEIEEGIYVEN